jgi:hypothetical protein
MMRPVVFATCFALVSCNPSLAGGARTAAVACAVADAVTTDPTIASACMTVDALSRLAAALTRAGVEKGDLTVTVRQQSGAETTVVVPAEVVSSVAYAIDAARDRVEAR